MLRKWRSGFVVVGVGLWVLALAACSGAPGPSFAAGPSPGEPTTAPPVADLTQVPLSASAAELAAAGQGQLRAVKHQFFPLEGKHATTACLSCHVDNQFVGLPETCEGCHQQDKPAQHFAGACVNCHTPAGWNQVVAFDHAAAGATDCLSCHLPDRPANHFQGQCSSCHTTTAWRPASFDHAAAGATDCISCHLPDRPANHFQGQCSSCHTTTAWRPASFDHGIFPITHGGAGGDCTACHTTGNPPDYTCTTCHSQASLVQEHAEEGIFNFANNCMACHAGGSSGEGGEYEGSGDEGGEQEGGEDEGGAYGEDEGQGGQNGEDGEGGEYEDDD